MLRASFLLLAFALFFILAFSAFALGTEDPELKQCKHQCRAQQGIDEEEILECSRRCDSYHKEKMEREGRQRGEEQEEQKEDNPYVFRHHHFTAKFQTRRGSYRVLPKFTERSQKLFKGIENIRLAVLEAEPLTFVVPNHWDADVVSLVLQGIHII